MIEFYGSGTHCVMVQAGRTRSSVVLWVGGSSRLLPGSAAASVAGGDQWHRLDR